MVECYRLALDSETKLIITHYVGLRGADSAWELMRDRQAKTEGMFSVNACVAL